MSRTIPLNLYTVKKTLAGEVVETKLLTPQSRSPGSDVTHITIRTKDAYPYVPGQSAGIIPPDADAGGKPHKLRLYSIASEAKGDSGDGTTTSLCVSRHSWNNEKTGEKNIPGLASNYLCDLKVGDPVTMTGPVGRHFLLPDDFKKRDLIFVATGTGIAPYRGMLKEMFDSGYEGRVSLYFGIQYGDVVLYDDEFKAYQKHKNFCYVKAISREEPNPVPNEVPTRENRMYVQVKLYVNRAELMTSLRKPDSMIYLCGLKGMEQGIFPILEKIGGEIGEEGSVVQKLKAERRLKIEVY